MNATVPRGVALSLDFAKVRPLFAGHMSQLQVDGINRILAAFNAHGDGDKRHLAYLLATALHETDRTMAPIREYGLGKKHPYGHIDVSGKAPYGRGLVQLTWRENYLKADQELGLGGKLAADYDLALDPDISARVLVTGCLEGWFTGKTLGDFRTFREMRRVINGMDRAEKIAGYADVFLSAIGGA